MKQKQLTVNDLEQLNDAAEYIVSSAQFLFPSYNDEGEYIGQISTNEERMCRIERWYLQASSHPLCFRQNEELRKITFHDALYMPLSEVKEKYLKDHMAKLRSILRKGTIEQEFSVADSVPDDYLEDLLALRWKENLKLWTIQWENDK